MKNVYIVYPLPLAFLSPHRSLGMQETPFMIENMCNFQRKLECKEVYLHSGQINMQCQSNVEYDISFNLNTLRERLNREEPRAWWF